MSTSFVHNTQCTNDVYTFCAVPREYIRFRSSSVGLSGLIAKTKVRGELTG